MQQKLLIIDDEISICNLIKMNFETEGYTVYIATDTKKATELLAKKPELILLDINMPDVDGIEYCKKMRKYIDCPIIFLTSRISEQDKIYGLQVGADDYITKPFSIAELTARVKAHLRRENRGRSHNIKFSGKLMIDYNERCVYYKDEVIPFSKKEFDIIEFLSINAGQVFTREMIYERLWGYDADGNSDVIKEHIRKIRSKMLKVTDVSYIDTVWGVGYKWIK